MEMSFELLRGETLSLFFFCFLLPIRRQNRQKCLKAQKNEVVILAEHTGTFLSVLVISIAMGIERNVPGSTSPD
jgi:hypothetical protein